MNKGFVFFFSFLVNFNIFCLLPLVIVMAHLKGLSYPSAGRDIKAYPHILFLAALCGMQDFSFPTRDQICAPAMGVPKFNHRTSRESSVQFSSVQLLSRVRLFLTP